MSSSAPKPKDDVQAAVALLVEHLRKVCEGDPEALALDKEVSKRLRAEAKRNAQRATADDVRAIARELREQRRHLRKLTDSVMLHLAYLDAVMKLPSTLLRGSVVAALSNMLELENDLARHAALGVPLKRLSSTKPKVALTAEQLPELRERLKAWIGLLDGGG